MMLSIQESLEKQHCPTDRWYCCWTTFTIHSKFPEKIEIWYSQRWSPVYWDLVDERHENFWTINICLVLMIHTSCALKFFSNVQDLRTLWTRISWLETNEQTSFLFICFQSIYPLQSLLLCWMTFLKFSLAIGEIQRKTRYKRRNYKIV